MLFVCYSRCSTCAKAKKWLEGQRLAFDQRDIKGENPKAAELKDWHQKSGLPIKRLFNTSGIPYRQLKLKDRLALMSDDDCYDLLATDGMLVKRPVLIDGDTALFGFQESEWEAKLL